MTSNYPQNSTTTATCNSLLRSTLCACCVLLMILLASPVARAAWTQDNVTMQVGETKTLYLPTSVTSLTLRSVNFYSASISYVTVQSHTTYSVTVKAIKATSTPVVVRCDYYYLMGSYQYSGAHDFLITVTGSGSGGGNPDITSLKISPSGTINMKKGESYTFTANYTPSTSTPDLHWYASGDTPQVISVTPSSNGKTCTVKALSAGWAWINVDCDNVSNNLSFHQYCKIIIDVDATGVSLSPVSTSLDVGKKATITATLTPIDATNALTWSSTNSSVATVSGSGNTATITAKSPGTTYITVATDNGHDAFCKVTVNAPKPTSITLPSSLSLKVGETATITPTLQPSGSQATISWQSAKPAVATVSNSGVVTGVAPGEATIIASTDNGLTAFCNVAVTQASNPLDINGDGSVTSVDITTIYNIILSGSTQYAAAADVDGDGAVTSTDITVIYNSILGTNK